MWIAILMLGMGVGSSAAAVMHFRDGRRGRPVYYPLFYDLLGALGFLTFGAGSLVGIEFFAGSGRWWLLLLIPIAVDKWRRTLMGRACERACRKHQRMQGGTEQKG